MRFSRYWSLAVTPLLVFALAVPAFAGDKKKEAKKPEKKPDFPPFKKAMEDYAAVPNYAGQETPLLKLWYNKKTDSLRAAIPGSMIGNKFIVAASMSGGPAATGFQLDHFLAYFEKMDKDLVLMRVDPRYKNGGSKPIADVVKRSYGSDDILGKIRIITMDGGNPVISLDQLFKADFSGLSGMGMGGVNADLSKWTKYKVFKENAEFTVDQAFMGRGAGKRMLMSYSVSTIPDSAKNYKPRKADDRIGYFMTTRLDWQKGYDQDTLFDRYINRWHLEKRDPSLKLSAPKNPIVWYIEKTVPVQYRRWVKEGILEWNKAFEKCGYLDAIEVVQQEDYDPRTKDLDPEDVRYNFFRWIVTGRGFAMGPSRAHPLTGQIFDADIVMDDAMVRVYLNRYDMLTGDEKAWQAYDPFTQAFHKAFPRYQHTSPRQLLLPNVKLKESPEEVFYNNLMKRMYKQGKPMCECASGMASQLQFAAAALEAKGVGRNMDEFIGQLVKEVVMHEVGHCLGLRHNFKASTWLPMEEILASTNENEATCGSVMDYNPPLIAPRGKDQGSFAPRTIGPYDYWAIEYGYRPVEEPYKNEDDMLGKIAGRSGEPGLQYATDEDVFGSISPDPYANRFDMGKDIMAFAESQIKLAESLISDMADWAVEDGESYSKLRKVFQRVMGQRAAATSYVARMPGGLDVSRSHKGDKDAKSPMVPVPADKQRAALEFVCDNVFAEDAYEIDPKLLNHLAAGRYWHWNSDEFDFFVDFNIHDFVASSQNRCLMQMMDPFTIGRIHDNQVKFTGDDIYTLGEHIMGLTDAIWSELDDDGRKGTKTKPFINSYRRNLQRSHVDELTNLVLSEPGTTMPADANAVARLALNELSNKLGKALDSATLDLNSKAHLMDVKTRIDKALKAEVTISSGGGGGGFFFFRPTEAEEDDTLTVLPQR